MTYLTSIVCTIRLIIWTFLIWIFSFNISLVFFVVIQSIIWVSFHIWFSDWGKFGNIKQLFTSFDLLDIRLTLWTRLATFSFKNKVLSLSAVKTWISVTCIWSDIRTFFSNKERILSKSILLSNVTVNIFITWQDVFRTNFLEIYQIFNFRTFFFSYIEVRSWLITLCTTCCGSEWLWGITQNKWMWLLKSILLNFVVCQSIIIISKHSWLSIGIDQCDVKLLQTSWSLRVKYKMIGTILTLFFCVIEVRSFLRTIETGLSILSIRSVTRTYFPSIWIVILYRLLLIFEWT